MSAVTLHRIDPARNVRRYYRLDMQPDLFGLWMFIREWGRIGRSGQTREASFATLDEAHRALQRQLRTKEKRGYVETENAVQGPRTESKRRSRGDTEQFSDAHEASSAAQSARF
jgi:predicted DNA-binding WGR domain protein